MIWSLLCSLISVFKTHRSLAFENLALRQQFVVLQRSVKRPRLSSVDRGFWVLLRRVWSDWDSVVVIVKPETVGTAPASDATGHGRVGTADRVDWESLRKFAS